MTDYLLHITNNKYHSSIHPNKGDVYVRESEPGLLNQFSNEAGDNTKNKIGSGKWCLLHKVSRTQNFTREYYQRLKWDVFNKYDKIHHQFY
jgi:hypothetical protein